MLKRTEAEQILGEWGVRDVTPDERVVRDRLAEELEGHPLKGKPLRRRYRNFTPDPAGYVASLGGPLPYMQRLKEIEELTELHLRRLEEAGARSPSGAAATRTRSRAAGGPPPHAGASTRSTT